MCIIIMLEMLYLNVFYFGEGWEVVVKVSGRVLYVGVIFLVLLGSWGGGCCIVISFGFLEGKVFFFWFIRNEVDLGILWVEVIFMVRGIVGEIC